MISESPSAFPICFLSCVLASPVYTVPMSYLINWVLTRMSCSFDIGDGWPGMATAVQKDGLIFQTDYNSSWGTVLNKHLQFRCKICPDGTGEFADIVCADAWYGKDGYPDFTEREGRSLILVRTPVGETLLNDAVAAGNINTSNLAIEEIAHMQPYQQPRKQLVSSRLIGTWLAFGAIKPRYQNLKLMNNSLSAKPMEWLRSMAGTVRRAKEKNSDNK